ncbi:MAG: hypothetical protein IPJ69_04400 [Deltaproteobacteria bacterium]|nr:MAG: hypothetical protein IPJ69_04400 [Deltaproteobacteria bacterium]
MEDDINLLELIKVVLKHKRSIIIIVLTVTLVSILYALSLKKTYLAEATLMAAGSNKAGGASLMAQLALGVGGSAGNSNQILAIFRSRALAEKLIQKYALERVLFEKEDVDRNLETIIEALNNTVTFTEDKKSQLIIVSAVYKDPKLAADMVNHYIEEAGAYIRENAFTAAKRNRIFIEGQLEGVKKDLLESGKELTEFYKTNNVSNVNPMLDVNVSLEETDDRVKNENSEVEKIQAKIDDMGKRINQTKIVKNVPQQVYLQYLTVKRELLGQVHGLLTQQYEMAKIEEQKEELNFQVVDWARVPFKKYKPKRAIIVIQSFIMAIILGVFYAFLREYLEKMKSSLLGSDRQINTK